MDINSKEYQQMRDKALVKLRSAESLTGKDGAFAPFQEMAIHFQGIDMRIYEPYLKIR